MRVGRTHLAQYSHVNAPKKYTQPQLFSCLILKALLGVTYRRIEEMLILMPAVREATGLQVVPRFTTLQTFADRADLLAIVDHALRTLGRSAMQHTRQDAAVDGTGLEVTSASAHFISNFHGGSDASGRSM